jgi:hypothetical protein
MNNIANGNDNKQFSLFQFGSPNVQSMSRLEDIIFRNKVVANECGHVNNTEPRQVIMLLEFDRTETWLKQNAPPQESSNRVQLFRYQQFHLDLKVWTNTAENCTNSTVQRNLLVPTSRVWLLLSVSAECYHPYDISDLRSDLLDYITLQPAG